MNQVSKALGLTRAEWVALEHRLSGTDSLGEVLSDEELPPEERYAAEDVEHVADLLARGHMNAALSYSTGIVGACLIDSVEGSTWVGVQDTPQGESAAYRILCQLAAKVETYLKMRPDSIRVPTC